MRTSSKVPDEAERALVVEQSRLRGQIIGAYCQAEFLLLDVAIQARILREYWGLDLKYHRKLENRINQARLLFAADGPLKKYEPRVLPLIARLEPLKDDRDFLAHSFCRIHCKGEAVSFIYVMLKMDGDEMHRVQRTYQMPAIAEFERNLTELAQEFLLLFSEIYIQEKLEELPRSIRTMP